MWLHIPTITESMGHLKKTFQQVEYSNMSIPTYPCGQIGCILAVKGKADVKTPQRDVDENILADCRYYSPAVHEASFVLPSFVQRQL
jgi:spermidine synthase